MIEWRDGKQYMRYKKPDGSYDWMRIGGQEYQNLEQQAQDNRASYSRDHFWDSGKDYSSTWGDIFGGVKGHYDYTPSFGEGKNQNWGHALMERLRHRERGDMDKRSWYEHFDGHSDQRNLDSQIRQDARNNAIEDMHRKGYSRSQIKDHVEGRTNINSVNPDYSDYYAYLRGEMKDGESFKRSGSVSDNNMWDDGMLSGLMGDPEQWMKDYFQFDHDTAMSSYARPQNEGMWNNGIKNNTPNKGQGGFNAGLIDKTGGSNQRPKRLGVWGSGYTDGGYGLLSGENDQMRQAITNALEKKLLG